LTKYHPIVIMIYPLYHKEALWLSPEEVVLLNI
jgi:hypothetical protein